MVGHWPQTLLNLHPWAAKAEADEGAGPGASRDRPCPRRITPCHDGRWWWWGLLTVRRLPPGRRSCLPRGEAAACPTPTRPPTPPVRQQASSKPPPARRHAPSPQFAIPRYQQHAPPHPRPRRLATSDPPKCEDSERVVHPVKVIVGDVHVGVQCRMAHTFCLGGRAAHFEAPELGIVLRPHAPGWSPRRHRRQWRLSPASGRRDGRWRPLEPARLAADFAPVPNLLLSLLVLLECSPTIRRCRPWYRLYSVLSPCRRRCYRCREVRSAV